LCVSEDSTPLTTERKIETVADVAEVSLIVGSVPVGIATQPTLGPLTEVEIVALVATRL
jgi:hypothetical protein